MISNILYDLLHKLFSKNKHFGNIRTKHETSAPLEWRESFFDKFKKGKLFHPIDINNKEHFKEFRIKVGKKFVIVAINIFLISFSYNIAKDTYNISKANYLIFNVSKKDFSKDIPVQLLIEEQNKIQNLKKYIEKRDILNIAKTTNELSVYARCKEYIVSYQKNKYIEDNKNSIKGNILSFINNLFILYLILKNKVTRQQ